MHIEKNVCENVFHLIFGQNDIIKVQWDMQVERIR
jgi:hypothetical protein